MGIAHRFIKVGADIGAVTFNYGEIMEVLTVVDILKGDEITHLVKTPVIDATADDFTRAIQAHRDRQDRLYDHYTSPALFGPYPVATDAKFRSGDYVCFNGMWNAVIFDYLESPITGTFVYRVMAAKNLTRAQYRGEEWTDALLAPSTKDAFYDEYLKLRAEQDARLTDILGAT